MLRDGARTSARYGMLGPSEQTSDDRKEERCEGPRLTLAGGKGAKCEWEASLLVGAWVKQSSRLSVKVVAKSCRRSHSSSRS